MLKLLGITIDRDLKFDKHVLELMNVLQSQAKIKRSF